MIIGTVESCFIFWRQWCTSALLRLSTTAPKRMLFNSANLICDDFQHCLTIFFFFGDRIVLQHCWGYNSAKKNCSTVPIFDAFRHCWAFFVFRWQCCTSTLLMASTTVRKQRLFISANSWWLLAQLKMFFFCGGSVLLRHCWELVHQCRKDCYSTMPTFENLSALLINLIISGVNVVLRRCWCLVHQCQKNAIQQCQLLMIFGHCFFSGVKVVLGASGGGYYNAETKVVH